MVVKGKQLLGKIISWFQLHYLTFSKTIIIIIMYIYYALINALSAHMIHINLNTISLPKENSVNCNRCAKLL